MQKSLRCFALFFSAFLLPFLSVDAAAQVANAFTVSPSTASLPLGGSVQFIAYRSVSWTVSAGQITRNGLYTAPTVMPAANTVTVTATTGSSSTTVTVNLFSVSVITPSSVSLQLGATQQFTNANATSWSAVSGTISATGLYTAPPSLPASGTDTVTETGPNGSASATVTLIPPMPVITSISNGPLPLGVFTATINGKGLIASSVAQLNGTPMATTYSNGALTVLGFSAQSGPASITVVNGTLTSAPMSVQIGIKNPLATAAAARRFLEQAAFGPTPSEALHVQTIGFPAWLNEQFNLPQVSNYTGIGSSESGMPTRFVANAVTNQDQLRQRVAFALSQVFVTSLGKLIFNGNIIGFQNMLLADSFANYRQTMEDVTLSAAMGNYLDMANNAAANPATGTVANENYARELMQLFSTGPNLLNQDGTLKLDAHGLPIPTYSQFTITEFARVFTGWTYPPPPGQPLRWNAYPGPGTMVPYPSQHDFGAKTLLNGYVSPAGATQLQDVRNALDNIFNHPNVGPFVATQMIQHLVKSNPSPAYVSRIAAVFNDNGKHVRGDMAAVVSAVLLDPEARANDQGGKDLPGDGHLQEPVLFIAGMIRAFGGQANDQNYYETDLPNMGQDVFNSPSVFNYYSPSYDVPGAGLMGGEFQIYTPNNAIVRANEVKSLMFSQNSSPILTYGPGTSVDLSPFVALANTPPTLVDALDLTLTHGTMPSSMKAQVLAAVNAAGGRSNLFLVQTAAYVILSSGYYNVWH